MNLIKDFNNYQELGAVDTIALLAAEEYNLKSRQHLVRVLHVLEQIKNVINTNNLDEIDIKAIRIYPYQENDGQNKFEINLITSEMLAQGCTEEAMVGMVFDENLYTVFDQIEEIFEFITTDTRFMNDTSHRKIIELNEEGLKELQNYLLSPALQIGLEKAMLAQAVNPSTEKKEIPNFKI